MSEASLDTSAGHQPPALFATTQWSVVVAAGEGPSEKARAALEHLCRIYWYPLYAYIRREGNSPVEAQDLTQSFFARLLERRAFEQVRRERGRLRSFLLVSLKNFLASEWHRNHAQKRGGKVTTVALDELGAEERYALEPADALSADRIYERRWALTLLDQVLAKLETEYQQADKAELFAALKPALVGEADSTRHAEAAARLGVTENALKQALFRIRQRYRALLRTEIADTVAEPGEVDEELRHLIAVLRQQSS